MRMRAWFFAFLTSLSVTNAACAMPLVIDQAQALDGRTVTELTERLSAIERETGVRARLVFARSLNGRLAGEVGRDFLDPESGEQAVLLFVMQNQQVRIERSEALRERIPEGVWVSMLANDVLPDMRAVRQVTAARAGVDGMAAILESRYVARPVIANGEITALRDVGVVGLVAALLALGLFPRSRARIVSRGKW